MKIGFERAQEIMRRTAAWPYAPLVLLSISLVDFFVLWIPSDAFLIAALLGSPRRARVFVVTMVFGRMLGTSFAYWIAVDAPLEKITEWALMYHLEGAWEKSQSFFEKFGPLSLGITALTPFPMLFIALLATASGASLLQLNVFASLGAVLRYSVIALGVLAGLRWFTRKHRSEMASRN